MTNLLILSKKIRTLNGLYSLNDLHKAAGSESKHAPYRFMRNEQTIELIEEIKRSPNLEIGNIGINDSPVLVSRGGNEQGTWVCKELVYSYAMWISAKFHLQVIRAFDAMNNPTPRLIDDTAMTLNSEQCRHLQIMLNYVSKLEREELISQSQIFKLKTQLETIKSFCNEMDNELKALESHQNGKLERIRHVHLHKNFVLH